jgi:P4 family phage/plasmid primase-like protien
MGDLTAFRAAVSTLFKPGEHAVMLFGNKDTDGSGDILWLNDVQDPEHLPAYWTLSVPGWYDPEMGNLHVPKLENIPGVRSHHQDVCLDGHTVLSVEAGTAPDVFLEPSPFLVFEVDYLLVGKEKPTPEIKKLQRDAMAYAFQVAGFPFAVLTDSGGKSIHATVRLDDDFATIHAWRQSVEFRRLQDLAWVVFGNFDIGVMKQAGKARLVRTPGARRDDGSPQTILATGKRVSIYDLMAWFASQLTPEAQQEVWGREPIVNPESPLRQRYLRINKWRNEVTTPTTQHRGEHWRKIANSLAIAGCIEPRSLARPSPQAPYGQWHASWLWHVSAFIFNVYSSGWFFSQDNHDWERPDRLRWESGVKNKELLLNQLKFEKATDPAKNALVDQMMSVASSPAYLQSVQAQAQASINALPPVPSSMLPPPLVGGITGATLTTATPAPAGASPRAGKNYTWAIATLERDHIPQGHLVKLSEKQGGSWMKFDKDIWIDLPSDYARALLVKCVLGDGAENKLVSEIYGTLERHYLDNRAWVENPHAIAFQNGTLYVHPDRVEFKPSHDPADRLRSLVPCHYDPNAVCPTWENFIRWALPDPSRLSMLQEAFGYTLIPGQPYQSFFMFTGTGSNGKSVVLSALQALHKDSFETVALANLGSRFSLGTLGRKRLAIDTEAENVTHQVLGEGNSATAILKAWTGGDPVKIEAKKVQGWSETINAKYIMACNKRPRFADPTKGVWRRLKLLKFESHIEERQADRNLPQKLLAELPGIVNWAILGLVRLVRQNGFTQSEVLSTDLAEYQTDSDSVAQFIVEFLRPAPVDSKDAWFDLRPFHTAYKDYCGQMAVPPVGESEFRQRLGMHNVFIGRPGEQDPVMQCPAGFERMPGSQYWAVKGWRCYHPAYTTQTLIGSYVKTPTPQFAQQGAQR